MSVFNSSSSLLIYSKLTISHIQYKIHDSVYVYASVCTTYVHGCVIWDKTVLSS